MENIQPYLQNRQSAIGNVTFVVIIVHPEVSASNSENNKNAFQSNANHPLADSMGYIKLEGT